MAQTVTITLTTAGTDTGPFDLYSDADGYVTPFETGVLKAFLVAGYTSILVPDAATIIRVVSTGVCTNFVDLPINVVPSTTTTSSTSSTTTSTTTAAPLATIAVSAETFESAPSAGYLQFQASVTLGTTIDNLDFTGTYERYTNSDCTSAIAGGCNFIDVLLSAGSTLVTSSPLCPYTSVGGLSVKLLSLDVNGVNITSNDQIITVGGNSYRITGFGDCISGI